MGSLMRTDVLVFTKKRRSLNSYSRPAASMKKTVQASIQIVVIYISFFLRVCLPEVQAASHSHADDLGDMHDVPFHHKPRPSFIAS